MPVEEHEKIAKEKKGDVVMATKKTVAKAAKVEAPKTESVKAVTQPVAKETVKDDTVKNATVKEEAAKKEVVKKEAVKKETVKKEAVKKAPAKKAPAKKAEVKSEVHIQFEGKSYSQEDLMKMAKDVWKYDLKHKVGDLVSIELYVKPEENMVYYVMNKEMTGSFYI